MKMTAWMMALVATAMAGPTTQPATQPAPRPATRPTDTPETQPVVSAEVAKVLDAMEAAGKKYTALTAEVRYTEIDLVFEERTTYAGRVYYQRDVAARQPSRVRVHFDSSKSDGVKAREDRDYVFYSDEKGRWAITRNARTKQMVQYHIAAPGDDTDPLELGRGPFPLPFGQSKARVLGLFAATTRPAKKGDSKDTTYLKLVPRPKPTTRPAKAAKLRVKSIELWVRPDGLPVKILTTDTEGETSETATFTKIDTKAKLTDKDFKLPRPPSDWEYRIEPLPETRTRRLKSPRPGGLR